MDDATKWGRASWPGVQSTGRCTYTVSRGIAPGTAQLTISPRSKLPDLVGDLVMTDGVTTVTIPSCKIDKTKCRRDSQGRYVDLYILDRRWRWKDLGGIKGVYNQVDRAGVPYPYMVKTPYQLAELCLLEMGETNYEIILPNVSVLPPINWQTVPPAVALESLCTSLGCVVLYRLDTDSVLIMPQGEGRDLPEGHTADESIEMDIPERPDRVVCEGQAVRFQGRFRLKPMAKEWNGLPVPRNEVSYRPVVTVQQHKVSITVSEDDTLAVGNVFTIRLDDIEFEFVGASTIGADILTGLKAKIDLEPQLPYRAFVEGDALVVYGSGDGTPFSVLVWTEDTGGGTPTLSWRLTQQGIAGDVDPWAQSPVHTFANVRGTERLGKQQAIAFAKESVHKWFQLTIDDPAGTDKPVRIPDYEGVLIRREQIVLQQTKAQQIEPSETDDGVDEQGRPRLILDDQGRPKRTLFYDGHTRDKPAVCYGSYFIGTVARTNTTPESEVLVDFSIDPERQLIMFSQPVYFQGDGYISAAELVLEVAFNLRDPVTNAFVTIQGSREFPEPHFGTAPLHIVREDVQATVLGVYNADHTYAGALTDYPEARARCDYYLQAYMAQFEAVRAQERTYNGLRHIWLDGAIAQVTWTVGGGVPTTQASRNSEHSRVVRPLAERLRNGVMDAVVKGRRGANPAMGGGPGAGPGGMTRLWEPPASQSTEGGR